MKVERNSGTLPKWMSDLAECMRSDKQKKVAVKNVQNLPKVNWKDETFFVDFTKQGAVLYNSFGNEVQLVDGAVSVEDVNRYMNENSVVASLDGNDSTDSQDQVDGIEKTADVDVDLDGGEEVLAEAEESTEQTESNIDDAFESELQKIAEAMDECEDENCEPTEEVVVEQCVDTPCNDVVVGEDEIPQSSDDLEGEPSQSVEDVCEAPAQEVMSEDCKLNTVSDCLDTSSDMVGDTVYIDGHPCTIEGVITIPAGTEVEVVEPTKEVCEETPCEEVEEFVSKASYNKLLSLVKNLERKIAKIEKCDGEDCAEDKKVAKRLKKRNKLVAFTEAQHAYTVIPNDTYDLNSQELEVKHFNDSAALSQHIIDKEHELDLSNMRDRAKLNEYFLKDLLSVYEGLGDVIEEAISPTEEIPCEEVPCEEVAVEPVEEPCVECDPTEEVVVVPVETKEELAPLTEETIEEVLEAPVEDDLVEVVLLDDEDLVNEFTEQSCPMCHAKKALNGVRKVANVTGVACSKCGKEYAVTEDKIYVKK